jgi:hypothetical protein
MGIARNEGFILVCSNHRWKSFLLSTKRAATDGGYCTQLRLLRVRKCETESIQSRNKIASTANGLSGDSAITFYFTQQWAAVTSQIQSYVISVTSAIQFANYPTPSPLWHTNIVTLIHLSCACLVTSVLSVRTQGEFLWQGLALWRHTKNAQTHRCTIWVLHWMVVRGHSSSVFIRN